MKTVTQFMHRLSMVPVAMLGITMVLVIVAQIVK